MAAQSERPKQKLLDQACTELCRSMHSVLREKHYSIHTEHSYVNWIKRFIHLAVERRVAAL